MRWAIISDLHANLQAFEAVLGDIAAQQVDRTVCLGDAVGYGPQPAEVLSLLHAHVHHMVMGNHEAAVAGLTDASAFNDDARRMVAWTRGRLNESALKLIAKLPYKFAGSGFAVAHASFVNPQNFDYVETPEDARAQFAARPEPLLFVGHTHDPAIFVLEPSGDCVRYEPDTFTLEPGCRYLVNPGSAGLSRGSDFRASYCILDTDRGEVTFNRVVFDSKLFRRQVERCAGDSKQVAYVLALFDSHALPTLNKRVDFAAMTSDAIPSPRPPARIVVRKAAGAPPAAATSRKNPVRMPPSPRPVARIGAALLLAVAALAGLLIWTAQRREAARQSLASTTPDPLLPGLRASAPVGKPPPDAADAAVAALASAEPASPAPRSATTATVTPPPAATETPPEPAEAGPPPAAAIEPAAAQGENGTGTGVWQAVLKPEETVLFRWSAGGNWRRAGFPDAAGADAVLDLGRLEIKTLNVQLDQDITVGRLRVPELHNTSTIWMPGHLLTFDNGGEPAQWFRNRGTQAVGALRLTVGTDLQLKSTLEAHWSVSRAVEIKNRIFGPGGLIIEHRSNDGSANNRQVQFRGDPNTYEGGTVLNGRVSAARPSIFVAEKNRAFGTGDVTVNEWAQLILTDCGAEDDMIADGASLRLIGAKGDCAKVTLQAGVQETVGGLFFNGTAQAAGVWGSGASGAEHKNDEHFQGPGQLIVRPAATGRR